MTAYMKQDDLDEWTNIKGAIFEADPYEKKDIVIAVRSTSIADLALEELLLDYATDETFRKNLGTHIRTQEENGLPRFIAVTAQHGTSIDMYTDEWRTEILSSFCLLKENKRDYQMFRCDKATVAVLERLVSRFKRVKTEEKEW